jgi:hypothetical protein
MQTKLKYKVLIVECIRNNMHAIPLYKDCSAVSQVFVQSLIHSFVDSIVRCDIRFVGRDASTC